MVHGYIRKKTNTKKWKKYHFLSCQQCLLSDNNTDFFISPTKIFFYIDVLSATVLYICITYLWTEYLFFDGNGEHFS